MACIVRSPRNQYGPLDRQNNFNLLRLLAAAQVVLMHGHAHLHLPTNPILFWVASQFSGVACFFVISGFLVSDSYLRSSSAGSFFFKRALRIYPALLANIVALEILMHFAGQSPGAINIGYPAYLLTYLSTASNDIAEFVTGISPYTYTGFFQSYPSQVLWTLTVELSFYFVLPFFLSIAYRWRMIGSALIAVAMAASFAIVFSVQDQFYEQHKLLNVFVAPYFWVFGLGVMARLYWDEIGFLFRRKLLLWLLAYGAVAAITILYFGADNWLEYKLHPEWTGLFRIATMGCVVLSAAFSFKTLTAKLRLDDLDLSYGLYLWHMLVVMTLIGLGYTGSGWLWPVVFGGGLGLAALSWFGIEKRAEGWKRFAGRKKPIAQPG